LSDLKLRQTPAQFFAAVDSAIQEVGEKEPAVSIASIRALQRQLIDQVKSIAPVDSTERAVLREKLAEVATPVFIRLLEKGYSPEDLLK
jgi:hypothetical protein